MILKVPVTGAGAEWVRRAADAINALISAVSGLGSRTDALEAFQVTATPEIADLEGRMANVEGFISDPEASYFVFTPGALPGSPGAGMVAFDIADGKLKCHDGTIWNALF